MMIGYIIYGIIYIINEIVKFIITEIRLLFRGNILISEIFTSKSNTDRTKYLKLFKRNLEIVSTAIKSIDFISNVNTIFPIPEYNNLDITKTIDDIIENAIEVETIAIDEVLSELFIKRIVVDMDDRLDNICGELCRSVNEIMYKNKHVNRIGHKNNKFFTFIIERYPFKSNIISSNNGSIQYEEIHEMYEMKYEDKGILNHFYIIPVNEKYKNKLKTDLEHIYHVFESESSSINGTPQNYLGVAGDKTSDPYYKFDPVLSCPTLDQLINHIKDFKN